MSYTAERRAFDRLRSDCTDSTRNEYESAIRTLVGSYNTTIYENRFVVGGAVEVFTCALLRSVGLSCTLYSSQDTAGDLLLPNNRKLSLKASFRGPQSIKLLNQMGAGERTWDTATLFVISGVGIVYGTPDMVDPQHVQSVTDGVELKRPGLLALIEDTRNVFPMEIVRKPPTEKTGHSLKASTAVAKQILRETRSASLLTALAALTD